MSSVLGGASSGASKSTAHTFIKTLLISINYIYSDLLIYPVSYNIKGYTDTCNILI